MAKKVAPKADAGRHVMPAPPERIPPGTMLLVNGVTGAWEVVSLARLGRAKAVDHESTGRARTIVALDPVGRAKARAGRAKSAAMQREKIAAKRAVRNAGLLRSAEGMLRRGLSKSATSKHLGISRDRLNRILVAQPPKKPALP